MSEPQTTQVCRHCGGTLPLDEFECYPSGTRRRVCRRCKYQLYGVEAKRRWRLRQLAETGFGKSRH